MKKIFICVLTVLSVCSLCACGNLKDTVLDGYDNLIQLFSKQALTDDKDLVGERKYADDEYTGSYEAAYEGFNGEEFLFGGTALYKVIRQGGVFRTALSCYSENFSDTLSVTSSVHIYLH